MSKVASLSKPLAFWSGCIAIVTGIIVLFGWQYNIEIIKSAIPGAVSMKPNAALAFILVGFAQLSATKSTKTAKYITIICSSLIISIGLFSLLHLFFNLDLGIENFIYRETALTHGTIYPGVMSLNTAINFILLGIIYFLIAFHKQIFTIQFSVVYILSISVFVLFGYVTHLEHLVGSIAFAKMPYHTALLFILICGGVIASTSQEKHLFKTLEQKLFIGFAFSIAIVLYIFLLSASELFPVNTERETANTTLRNVQMLKSLQNDLTDVENDLEQYIFSGDPKYLHKQLAKVEEFKKQIDNSLKKDTNNPSLQKTARISRQLLEISKNVNESLNRNSTIDAHSLLILQSLINQAHDLTAFNLEHQLATLAAINELKIQNYKIASYIKIIGILLQISLISFLFIYTKNNIEQRMQAEELYRKANAQLKNRVIEQRQMIGYSEKRYRAVAENTPLAICNTLMDGTVIYANQACVNLIGHISAEAMYQKGNAPFFIRNNGYSEFQHQLNSLGFVKNFELTGLTEKAEVKVLSVSAWLDNDIVYYIITDITEHKITENKLINTNLLLSFLIEINKINDVTQEDLLIDTCKAAVQAGKFTTAWFAKYNESNKALNLSYITGINSGIPDTISLNSENIPKKLLFVQEAMQSGVYKIVAEIPTNQPLFTKSDLPSEISNCFSACFPIKVSNLLLGCFVVHSDFPRVFDDNNIKLLAKSALDLEAALTQLQISGEQSAIELARKKLSLAVEQSPVSVVITDSKGRIEYVNAQFCAITQYTQAEIVGKTQGFIKSGYHDTSFYKNLWNTILSGNNYRGEILNKKKNGEVFWEAVLISPLKNEAGTITNFITVKEDITEYKKLIEELTAAKEKAEEMSRLKSNFLANMSHELRTPLIGILGYADILSTEFPDPDIADMALTITESGERLKNTLNMILDLSRIGSEQKLLNSKISNVIPLIQGSVETYTEIARKKNLVLNSVYSSQELLGFIDEDLFVDALNNIIKNAVIYTKQGGISITTSIEKSDDLTHIKIDVADTGIGIDEKDYTQIFEEFRQASEGLSRSFEGTGLGLTLAKEYIESMNGTISVASTLGAGSTFTIRIPLVEGVHSLSPEASNAPKEPPAISNMTEEYSILYIEDDYISQKVVSRMLHNRYLVDTANSGKAALEQVKNKHYQCILMDINLGEGADGTEVTKEIRKIPEYKEIPIIAVTAYAGSENKNKFLAAGCTDYISKPFSQKELISFIKKVLN